MKDFLRSLRHSWLVFWESKNEKAIKKYRVFSLILFMAGVVIGMIFIGFAAWADFEASIFDTSIKSDETLKTLRCPIMIGKDHFGTVKDPFSNPSDRKINPIIQASISNGLVTLMQQDRARLPLEPGETVKKEWTVYPTDAVWGRFIMVRVLQYREYPVPSRSGSCGIVLINIPWVTGGLVTAILTASSVIFILVGYGIWLAIHRPLKGKNYETAMAMLTVGVIVLVGIAMIFVQFWMLAGLSLLLALLLLVVMSGYFILYS